MSEEDGLDESAQGLFQHIGELRARLIKALIGVVLITGACLVYSPVLLDYAVEPLVEVMQDNARVETLLVTPVGEEVEALRDRIEDTPRVRFRGSLSDLARAEAEVRDAADGTRPIDLLLVSAELLSGDGALVSDLLEGVKRPPFIVYLVGSAQDPRITELQLEGATVVLSPPRNAVLSRMVRRAAAAAGKAVGGDDKLVVLSPLEPFFAYIKVALVCGLFLTCPLWLYQAWAFIAPGLYRSERRAALPVVFSASLLFVGGGLFAYFVMFPMMFDVLINDMMPASLVGSFTVDNYLGLLLRTTVAFGVVFELPLILAALSAVGIVTPEFLSGFRRYAIILAFVLGAILTPADPVSQVMMAVPLILFYEAGIVLSRLTRKREDVGDRAHEDARPA